MMIEIPCSRRSRKSILSLCEQFDDKAQHITSDGGNEMTELEQVVQRAKADIAKGYVFVHMPIPQLETLLSGLEEAQREIENKDEELERIQLDANDYRDEYEALNRRFVELDKSAGETLDLLHDSSRTISEKNGQIDHLRAEHTAMKEALEWYANESIYNDAESVKNSSAVIDQGYTAQFVLSTLSKEKANED